MRRQPNAGTSFINEEARVSRIKSTERPMTDEERERARAQWIAEFGFDLYADEENGSAT